MLFLVELIIMIWLSGTPLYTAYFISIFFFAWIDGPQNCGKTMTLTWISIFFVCSDKKHFCKWWMNRKILFVLMVNAFLRAHTHTETHKNSHFAPMEQNRKDTLAASKTTKCNEVGSDGILTRFVNNLIVFAKQANAYLYYANELLINTRNIVVFIRSTCNVLS